MMAISETKKSGRKSSQHVEQRSCFFSSHVFQSNERTGCVGMASKMNHSGQRNARRNEQSAHEVEDAARAFIISRLPVPAGDAPGSARSHHQAFKTVTYCTVTESVAKPGVWSVKESAGKCRRADVCRGRERKECCNFPAPTPGPWLLHHLEESFNTLSVFLPIPLHFIVRAPHSLTEKTAHAERFARYALGAPRHWHQLLLRALGPLTRPRAQHCFTPSFCCMALTLNSMRLPLSLVPQQTVRLW